MIADMFRGRGAQLVADARTLDNTTLDKTSTGPNFAVDIDSGVLYGVPSLDDLIFGLGRVSRDEALRIPALKRARDLLAGGIGQFPLKVYGPDGREATTFTPNLFLQPEAGVAPSVTWSFIVEDLLLYGRSWLKVRALGWHGRVITATRLDPATVTIQPTYEQFPEGTALVWPDVAGLIRIDSPNAGILDASPAVRACIALERIAAATLDGRPPVDFFETDGVSPFTDQEQAIEFLDAWKAARQQRATALIPEGLKYSISGFDPEKLQLAEARTFAVLEIARLTGIDAEELSVSTTSRTYQNMQDRRRHRVEDVYGPYMTAIEGRLSMGDVTPRGFTVQFDTTNFLRLDDLAAAQADSVLVNAGILHPEEARAKRGLDPRDDLPAPKPASPIPATQEQPA